MDEALDRSWPRNVSWAVLGNVLYAAGQWAMLVAYARLAGAAELGEFTFGIAVTAPIVMFANMQLRHVQTGDARQEFGYQQYLGLRLGTSICALGAIAGIALMLRTSGYTALVVLAVGFAKTIESVSDVLYGIQQHQERLRDVALSLIIRGIGGACILAAVVAWTGSALAGALGLAITWAAVLLAFDLPRTASLVRQRGNSLRPDWTLTAQRRLVRLAYPLGVASFLASLTANVPRYFVRHHLGAADLGVFAAFAYLTSAGGTVVSALGQSALARLGRAYAGGHVTTFVRLVLLLAGIVGAVAAALWILAAVAGERVVSLLYGAGFREYVFLLIPVVGWATAQFLASLLAYCAAAVRQFRGQAPISLAAIAASLVTCIVAVPSLGILGAVWAGLAGASVQLVGNLYLVTSALLRDARARTPGAFGPAPRVVPTEH